MLSDWISAHNTILKEPFMKENRNTIPYCFRTSEQTMSMIESHMKEVNCQSKNEFIEKAIRWYCAKLDGESNDEIVTPELTKAIKAVVKQESNRLTKIMFKEAVATSMLVRFVAAQAYADDMDFEQLRAKAVKDVKESNGSLNIRDVFYEELDARNEE